MKLGILLFISIVAAVLGWSYSYQLYKMLKERDRNGLWYDEDIDNLLN